jgi:hypothetical protein
MTAQQVRMLSTVVAGAFVAAMLIVATAPIL